MTVLAEVLDQQFPGNGVADSFDFDFTIFDSSELIARDIVDATGVATLLVQGVDYTLSVSTIAGGTVTTTDPVASGHTLDLRPVYAVTQPTDIKNQGTFRPEVHERALDRLASQSQMLLRLIERCIQLPDYGDDDADLTMPALSTLLGKFLTVDAGGGIIGSSGTGADAGLRDDLASTVAANDGARLIGYRRTETGSGGAAVASVLRRQVWIEDFGGVPGAGDNTAAMNAAMNALVALGGGVINIATPGEWRMNWVCPYNNIGVRGFGGLGEFDVYCVRPFSLASAPITFGTGLVDLRYCWLDNLHVSGTDAPGTFVAGVTPTTNPNSLLAAHSAPHCVLLKGGMIGFRTTPTCVFYGGIRTFSCEPSATNPITGLRLYGFIRNDNTDSVLARGWYEERLADPGYITDNVCFAKGNGPWLGYAVEFKNNGGPGIVGEFAGNPYWDCKPFHGVKLTGNAGIRPENLDLDPGTTLAGIIESDQVLADINRFISGKLRHGGQSFVFSGTVLNAGTLQAGTAAGGTLAAAAAFADNELAGQTIKILTGTGLEQYRRIVSNVGATDVFVVTPNWTVIPNAASTYAIYRTVDIPAEADDFSYKQRLHTPSMVGARAVGIASGNTPYQTATNWEMQSATGPERLTGADLEVMKALRLWGSQAALACTFDAVGSGGGLRIDAQGTNQNIRVIPSGTGQVVLEGGYTRPSGDNTQDCGGASNRWKIVYAGTGAINTSDERVKDDIGDIPKEWLDAWGDVQWQRFRFKDAIAIKGDGARWHVGLIAQRVRDAFATRGLDARAIGLLCYDEWTDEYEDESVLIERALDNGELIEERRFTGAKVLIKKAGSQYALRYEEALAMECAYLRGLLARGAP